MNRATFRALRVALYAIFGMLIYGFYVEWLADGFKSYLETALGDYFNAVFLLVGILGLLLVIYLEIKLSAPEETLSAVKEQQLQAANRARLIADTRKRYISRREQKLNLDLNFEIKLDLKFIETKARDPIHEQFILNTKSKVQDYQQLFELYHQHINRLLILGEPGSGKTMLLLRLGEYLLGQAEQDEQHPVPIIFNLANWHGDSKDFNTWLEKQLKHAAGEAGISSEYAEELMKNYQVLPLLDGLDEVKEPLRKGCLDAVEKYLNQRTSRHPAADLYPHLVLCSRIAEFNALETGAPVLDTIEIQPLTPKAVKATLQGLASEYNWAAGQLLASFNQHDALRKALRTAFYVHTALSIVEDHREVWEEVDFETTSPVQIQEQIITAYLQQQLQGISTSTKYTPKEIAHYLSWLAYNLQTQKQSVSFELVDIQLPWWKDTRRVKWIYGLVFRLVAGLVFGLVFGLVAGLLVFRLVAGLVLGLFTGLVTGLVFGLIGVKANIVYDEITKFSFNRLNSGAFIRILKRGLVLGLIGGLIFGLIVGPVFGLVLGLIGGLVVGLIGGLVEGLVDEITIYNTFPRTTRPWQKVTSGLKRQLLDNGSWIMTTLIIIVIIANMEVTEELAFFQAFSLIQVLLAGVLLSFVAAFITDSSFRFLVLYTLLFSKGFIPINLVKFLNKVADNTGLMERDGGQWRFRHQLIHDAFIQLWIARQKSATKPPTADETPTASVPE